MFLLSLSAQSNLVLSQDGRMEIQLFEDVKQCLHRRQALSFPTGSLIPLLSNAKRFVRTSNLHYVRTDVPIWRIDDACNFQKCLCRLSSTSSLILFQFASQVKVIDIEFGIQFLEYLSIQQYIQINIFNLVQYLLEIQLLGNLQKKMPQTKKKA